MTTLALALLLVYPLAATASRPQDAQAPSTPRKEDLVLKYFTPASADSGELAVVARELFGENLTVALPFNNEEYVDRFISLGPTLVVQDTPKSAERILETLRLLDAEIGRASSAPARFEYSPRHVGLDSLMEGVRAFDVTCWPVLEGRMLVMTGSEDTIAKASELFARIDVPAPQVLLTCYLIRGLESGTSTPTLPRELVDNLKLILPMPGFELVSLNALQAAVRGQPIRLATQAGVSLRYELSLHPEVYDPAQSTLSLSGCLFELTDESQGRTHHLETSLDLRSGEYVVLGALGDEPLFVVLRMASTKPAGRTQ